MPRDGSGVYSRPPGTNGVPDTTIESTKYNSFVGDVETDLNAPRPIIAGGTGANSAAAARDNLDAEVAGKQVTNYDTHVWEAGSFYSLSSATSPPVAGHAFMGTAIVLDANNIMLEARDLDGTGVPPLTYVRHRRAGSWGAWSIDGTSQYVRKAGDTMSGSLGIENGGFSVTAADPTLSLVKTADANVSQMYVQKGGVAQWLWRFSDQSSNNLALYRCNAAGAIVDQPLIIAWLDGTSIFGGDVTISKSTPALTLNATATGTQAQVNFKRNNSYRWQALMQLDAETGGNAGSNFLITRISDAGTYLGSPLGITRATGQTTLASSSGTTLTVNGGDSAPVAVFRDNRADANAAIVVGGQYDAYIGSVGGYPGFFKDAGVTGGCWYDTNNNQFSVSGNVNATGNVTASGSVAATGNVTASGNVTAAGAVIGVPLAARSNTQPAVWWQNAAGSTNYVQFYHNVGVGRTAFQYQQNSNAHLSLEYNGYVNLGTGLNSRAGVNGTFNSPSAAVNACWTGGVLQAWVDVTNLGNFTISSDYRIKKDVTDLPSTWDIVKGLRPIRYTQAEYTPALDKANKLKDALQARELKLDVAQSKEGYEHTPMFAADSIERWGFVAHEVQEALLPSAAEGVKDQADCVQSLNLSPIVASLTKALQEAMARIEALEAKLAAT